MLNEDYPFAYRRGDSHVVVLNPRREVATLLLPEAAGAEILLGSGVILDGDTIRADGFGFAVLALAD